MPTLDLEIWVDDNNKIIFQFCEKPMVPETVIHARSAIPEATRCATLNQELTRRMVNTSELVSEEIRIKIVDKYAQKLVNSECNIKDYYP